MYWDLSLYMSSHYGEWIGWFVVSSLVRRAPTRPMWLMRCNDDYNDTSHPGGAGDWEWWLVLSSAIDNALPSPRWHSALIYDISLCHSHHTAIIYSWIMIYMQKASYLACHIQKFRVVHSVMASIIEGVLICRLYKGMWEANGCGLGSWIMKYPNKYHRIS